MHSLAALFSLLVAFLANSSPLALAAAMDADCLALLTEKLLAYERIEEPFRAPQMTREELEQVLVAAGLAGNSLIERALTQAVESHERQRRDNGSSYLEQHIFPVVTSIIREYRAHGPLTLEKVVAAALLHDALEDDVALTDSLFIARFGQEIYDVVKPLTKPDYRKFPGNNKSIQKWQLNWSYIDRIGQSVAEVRLIKLADRLNNLISTRAMFRDKTAVDPIADEKVVSYIVETEEFYLPMAQTTSFYYFMRIKYHLEKLKPLVPNWTQARADFFLKLGIAP